MTDSPVVPDSIKANRSLYGSHEGRALHAGKREDCPTCEAELRDAGDCGGAHHFGLCQSCGAYFAVAPAALDEARDYACSLLDRLVGLGQELERVRTALRVYQEAEE